MHCEFCGKLLEPGALFCSGCGSRVYDPDKDNYFSESSFITQDKSSSGDLNQNYSQNFNPNYNSGANQSYADNYNRDLYQTNQNNSPVNTPYSVYNTADQNWPADDDRRNNEKNRKTIILLVSALIVVAAVTAIVLVIINIYPEQDPIKKRDSVADETIPATHTYEVCKSDVSWTEAEEIARKKGGYLVTITTDDEYKKVCSLLDNNPDIRYCWVGARIYTSNPDDWNSFSWVTGETGMLTEHWYPGEPSGTDTDDDGNIINESFLCLWNVKYDELGWTFNDQRNDISGSDSECTGKIGYIIEYDE